MKCRELARLMPELAAGELDHDIRLAAEVHIKECASCAVSFEQYTKIEDALRLERSMVECPAALDELPIEDNRRAYLPWLRPAGALAAVGLAVVIAMALRSPKPVTEAPRETARVPVKQGPHVATVEQSDVKVISQDPETVTVPATRWTAPRGGIHHSIGGHKPTAPAHEKKPRHEQRIVPVPEHSAPMQPETVASEPDNPDARIMVVASSTVTIEPFEVEVRSVNRRTGEARLYQASMDESGNASEMSISTVRSKL